MTAPLTVQELRSTLWGAANILRGSAVDRTDWKGYILPLLFLKRISDVWGEETAEATELYGDAEPGHFEEVHRFQIPEGCHWRQIRETPANIAHARAVATKCNIRHRRIVSCVVFLSPTRRLGRPRSHLSRVPPTYRRFPCDRARNIRDNIRHKRVGPISTASVNRYESYSYDDIGLSSIADDPSPRPPSLESSTGTHAAPPRSGASWGVGSAARRPAIFRAR